MRDEPTFRSSPVDLEGTVALVTGGAGAGIAAGVCAAIVAAGGSLVICDKDDKAVDAAAERFPEALAVHADIRDAAQMDGDCRDAESKFGIVDRLVNNAGVGISRPLHEVEESEYDALFDVDVRAVWRTTKQFVRRLLAAERPGSIVNVSSVHARATIPRYSLYATAKAAVEGMTRGIAYEYGTANIRCNAIAPGYVHADQNYDLIRTWNDDPKAWVQHHTKDHQALQFEITPEDCGNLAVFLLSDASRCITGQSICIDAGMTAMLYNRDFLS